MPIHTDYLWFETKARQEFIRITDDGDLDLGPWEQVFYAERDGQRRTRVVVTVMGE